MAVLQGIGHCCVPAGQGGFIALANQPARNCRTSGGRREPAAARLTTSRGMQVMVSVNGSRYLDGQQVDAGAAKFKFQPNSFFTGWR